MQQHGLYRKMNDRTCSSSTYHKKDGTNVRAKLKEHTRNLQQCGETHEDEKVHPN